MPSPILARADALMQRRRQNLADTEDVPVLTDSVGNDPADSDDDIPVLFAPEPGSEVITRDEEATPEERAPDDDGNSRDTDSAEPPSGNTILNEAIILELARRVEKRLLAALPRIIEGTVRDFLAEQGNSPNGRETDNT